MVGGEDSKYRYVVKKAFQKTSLHQKGIGQRENKTTITTTVFLGPGGGIEQKRFQQTRSTHSGAGEKETLNNKIVGKTSILKLNSNKNKDTIGNRTI